MLNRNPLLALGLAAFLLSGCGSTLMAPGQAQSLRAPAMAVQAKKKKNVAPAANKDWVVVSGDVSKLLPTDNNGSRHQHFLVKVPLRSGGSKTIKIAHNIDLAPVVPVEVGDAVTVKCEYIKASPYDVAHWTHYDPRGGEGGYIEFNGKKYDRL